MKYKVGDKLVHARSWKPDTYYVIIGVNDEYKHYVVTINTRYIHREMTLSREAIEEDYIKIDDGNDVLKGML